MITVIGPGCVGKGLTYLLSAQGCEVALLGRQGPVSCQQDVRVKDDIGRLDLTAKAVSADSQLILVAVKAYSLTEACAQHLHKFRPGSTVVCLSNGYVVPEIQQMASEYSKMCWRAGVVKVGFKEVDGILEISPGKGRIFWGALDDQNEPGPIEQKLLDQHFFNWTENPVKMIRSKWLQNVVINHLSVYFSLAKNGGLLDYPSELKEVFEQAYDFGQELWGSWDFDKSQGFEDLTALISSTANNENSMHRDVRMGRRTEFDSLIGLVNGNTKYPWLLRLFNESKPS